VAHAREHGSPVSVAMLDLDHFKRVNDYYDHATGDRALRELSMILERTLRSGDLAFRWGGEEFLVLLLNADRATAAEVVRRIRQELRSQSLRPIEWPLTLSAGIAGGSVPEGEDTLRRWIASADSGLLRAKEAGRDRVEAAV
jgi:diguanylate cyclase (GGDEF)-like protein